MRTCEIPGCDGSTDGEAYAVPVWIRGEMRWSNVITCRDHATVDFYELIGGDKAKVVNPAAVPETRLLEQEGI